MALFPRSEYRIIVSSALYICMCLTHVTFMFGFLHAHPRPALPCLALLLRGVKADVGDKRHSRSRVESPPNAGQCGYAPTTKQDAHDGQSEPRPKELLRKGCSPAPATAWLFSFKSFIDHYKYHYNHPLKTTLDSKPNWGWHARLEFGTISTCRKRGQRPRSDVTAT